MSILMLFTLLDLGDPAETLARAVSLIETCRYETRQKTLDDNHREIPGVKAGNHDVDPAKSLSIPILFKSGRYRLEEGGRALFEGREVSIVNFFPLPEKNQLKPSLDEDKRFNRAMNFLTGSVFIDTETGGIVRVETRIAQEVPYEKFLMTVFKINELEAVIEQQLTDTRWRPRKFEMEWRGRSKAGLVKLHEAYEVEFSCTP